MHKEITGEGFVFTIRVTADKVIDIGKVLVEAGFSIIEEERRWEKKGKTA